MHATATALPTFPWSVFIPATGAAVAFLCGGVIVLQNRHSRKNRLFGLFCAAAGIGGLGYSPGFLPFQLTLIWPAVLSAATLLHYQHVVSLFGHESARREKMVGLAYVAVFADAVLLANCARDSGWIGALLGAALIISLWSFAASIGHFLAFLRRVRSNRFVFPLLLLTLFLSVTAFGGFFAQRFFPPLGLFMPLYIAFAGLVYYRLMFLDIFVRREKATLVLLAYGAVIAVGAPVAAVIVAQDFAYWRGDAPAFFLLMTLVASAFFTFGTGIYALIVRYQVNFRRNLISQIVNSLPEPLARLRAEIEAAARPNASPAQFESVEAQTTVLENGILTILDLTKIQEERVVLESSVVNLSERLDDLAAAFVSKAREKNIALITIMHPTRPIALDVRKIDQVLERLLFNALRFSTEGSITVTIEQKISEIIISVADQGRGLTFEEMGRVFERRLVWPRFDQTAGCNLAVSRGWVLAHRGKIWAESDGLGKGTRMSVALPN